MKHAKVFHAVMMIALVSPLHDSAMSESPRRSYKEVYRLIIYKKAIKQQTVERHIKEIVRQTLNMLFLFDEWGVNIWRSTDIFSQS